MKRLNHRPPKERRLHNALDKDYYTIQEVAELFGFHHNTIRRMIKSGKLEATQFNRVWRIKKTAIEKISKPSNIESD